MSANEPPVPTPDGHPAPVHAPDFTAPTGFAPAPAPYPASPGYSTPAGQGAPVSPPAPPSPAPAGYPSPQAYPAPATYPAQQPYPDPATHPAPQGYPAAPTYAAPAGQPAPAAYPAYAPAPGIPGPTVAPAAVGTATERVGRGLVFSLGSIVVGVALTMVLWQLNFIASITSFAMAYSAIWLYTKGAGRSPARGAAGLILVIVLGVAASLASLVVADSLTYLAQNYPEAPLGAKLQFVLEDLANPGIWENYTRDIAMYVLFAALGTFRLVRLLGRARRAS